MSIGDGTKITVTFGTCGFGTPLNAGELWIDFNRNEEFDSGESVGSWEGTTNPESVHDFVVNVPGDFSGETRARLRLQEVIALLPGYDL